MGMELNHVSLIAELNDYHSTLMKLIRSKYRLDTSKNYAVSEVEAFKLDLMRELPNFKWHSKFSLSNRQKNVFVIIVDTYAETIRYRKNTAYVDPTYDRFLLCVVKSRKDFGRSIIRRENFLDKIAEFFRRVEIDVEQYPEFCKKFYCLSNEPEKFISALDQNFCDKLISAECQFQMEHSDNHWFCLPSHSVRKPDEVMKFLELMFEL
jgi:hypothetical protein